MNKLHIADAPGYFVIKLEGTHMVTQSNLVAGRFQQVFFKPLENSCDKLQIKHILTAPFSSGMHEN